MGRENGILSDEERAILETVSEFRTRELEDVAMEIDEHPDPERISNLFRNAAPIGFCSCLGKSDSGIPSGLSELIFGLREIAYASCGFAVLILSHNLALLALEQLGEGVDLEPFANGEKRAAYAACVVNKEGVLQAGIVPGGWNANAVVLHVRGEPFLYYVENPSSGLTIEKIDNPLGFRASLPASALLDPSVAPVKRHEISPESSEILQSVLLLGLASVALGITRRAYDVSRAYAKDRYQGGDYIIKHEQMRIYLGEMVAGIRSSEAVVSYAKGALSMGVVSPSMCKTAKILAARFAMSAALNGVQIHGGYGYMRDYGMERLMRDAKYCQSFPKSEQEELLEILDSFPEKTSALERAGRDIRGCSL